MEPENNPYAAPEAVATLAEAESMRPVYQVVPVSHGLRFANFIIDRLACYGLSYAIGIALGIVGGVRVIEMITPSVDFALTYLIAICYFTVAEGFTGRSLGKLITGTIVVDHTGHRAPFSKGLLRGLCRCIPFDPFSYLVSDARGWHDSITKTWVVKAR